MFLKVLTTLACVLIFLPASFAQRDFRPGYVVKDGDTLKGLVQYGRKRASQEALFKSGKHDKAKVFTSTEASAYGFVGDKQYVSIDIGTAAAPRKVFVIALQKGEIDLYFTKGRFVLIKGSEMTVLERKPDSTAEVKNSYGEKKGTAIVRDLRYMDQLNTLVYSDCGLNANTIKFSRSEISSLIGNYNKCKNNFVEIRNPRPGVRFGVSGAFGMHASTLVLDTLPNTKFKADVLPVFQFDLELRFPRITDRLAVSLGLQPINSTYKGLSSVTSSTTARSDEMTMKVRYFKVPITFKYNFGNPANSVFVRFGTWQGFLNDVKFTTHRTARDLGTNLSESADQKVPNGYRNPAGSFLGVGYDKSIVKRLRVFCEFRYEINSGFVGNPVAPYSGYNFMHALIGIGF